MCIRDRFQFAQRPFLWMEKIHEHRGTITSATNTGIEHLSAYIGLRADRLPEVDLSCLKVDVYKRQGPRRASRHQ